MCLWYSILLDLPLEDDSHCCRVGRACGSIGIHERVKLERESKKQGDELLGCESVYRKASFCGWVLSSNTLSLSLFVVVCRP